MNLDSIKQTVKELKDKVTKKPPLERLLLNCTSNENWTTPTKML